MDKLINTEQTDYLIAQAVAEQRYLSIIYFKLCENVIGTICSNTKYEHKWDEK